MASLHSGSKAVFKLLLSCHEIVIFSIYKNTVSRKKGQER